jgi:hypothetical protein
MSSQISIQRGLSGQPVALYTTRKYILARDKQKTEWRGEEEVPKRLWREIK